ncbi:unnamed protein product [Prorocentrum cordatum]|uniref:RNA-directed RNA polymerase n=1 Tax=Prorocentrum cordatum TaxID=2364126 RepID=A0ABN9T069_9DINO|nr:unnamed protein product [Polarella glacialis]
MRLDGWPQPSSAVWGSWRRLVIEVVGEAFMHERLVIRVDPNGCSAWAATPDQDGHEEDYRHDPDIVGFTFLDDVCGDMKISGVAVIAPAGPIVSVKAVSAGTLPSEITVAVFLEWALMQKFPSFRDDRIDLYASEVRYRRIMKSRFEHGACSRTFNAGVLGLFEEPEVDDRTKGPRIPLGTAQTPRSQGSIWQTQARECPVATRIPPGKRSVREFKLVREVLKAWQRIDRCNLANTMGADLLVRRRSLLGGARASFPSNSGYSTTNIMMGWAVALLSVTASRLKDKAAVLKGERKAFVESRHRCRRLQQRFDRKKAVLSRAVDSVKALNWVRGRDYAGGPELPIASHDKDLLSMPQLGAGPVDLSTVLEGRARECLVDFEEEILHGPDDWGHITECEEHVKPYMDPVLKTDADAYFDFVMRGHKSGLFRFGRTSHAIVTPFFVRKKAGTLRLILDCRPSNRRMRESPYVRLGGPADVARLLHSRSDGDPYVALGDVKDYFHCCGLPPGLSPYLSLPPASGLRLLQAGIHNVEGVPVLPGDRIFPQSRVVPMGWSWACYFAQSATTSLVHRFSGSEGDSFLESCKPPPGLDRPAYNVYIDNISIFGQGKSQTDRIANQVFDGVESVGFRVHERASASKWAHTLGLEIDFLLLGHTTFHFGPNRLFLSIFNNAYDFIRSSYTSRVRLWPSVARECWAAGCLISFAFADLGRDFDPFVSCFDASMCGAGVVTAPWDSAQVRSDCEWEERWRFKWDVYDRVAPRDNNFLSLDWGDIESVKPCRDRSSLWSLDNSFREVPKENLVGPTWTKVVRSFWKDEEPIFCLEARAGLLAVRHKLRAVSSFGKTHLHLGDSMTAILAFEKGRAKHRGLSLANPKVCDDALCGSADPLFLDGERIDAGTKFRAALEDHDVQRFGKPSLPRLRRVLQVWHRKGPVDSRDPLPFRLLAGILGILSLHGFHEEVLALTLMVICSLRLSELVTVAEGDPFEPVVGHLDDTLPLDSPDFPGLGALLAGLRRGVVEVWLFSFSQMQLLRRLQAPLRMAGLGSLNIQMYQLLHGGASTGFLMWTREIQAVRQRERWADDRSLLRSMKADRGQLLHKVMAPVSNRWCQEAEVFSGSGRLAKSFAELGIPALSWDIEHGPAGDLLDGDVLRCVLSYIASGRTGTVF